MSLRVRRLPLLFFSTDLLATLFPPCIFTALVRFTDLHNAHPNTRSICPHAAFPVQRAESDSGDHLRGERQEPLLPLSLSSWARACCRYHCRRASDTRAPHSKKGQECYGRSSKAPTDIRRVQADASIGRSAGIPLQRQGALRGNPSPDLHTRDRGEYATRRMPQICVLDPRTTQLPSINLRLWQKSISALCQSAWPGPLRQGAGNLKISRSLCQPFRKTRRSAPRHVFGVSAQPSSNGTHSHRALIEILHDRLFDAMV